VNGSGVVARQTARACTATPPVAKRARVLVQPSAPCGSTKKRTRATMGDSWPRGSTDAPGTAARLDRMSESAPGGLRRVVHLTARKCAPWALNEDTSDSWTSRVRQGLGHFRVKHRSRPLSRSARAKHCVLFAICWAGRVLVHRFAHVAELLAHDPVGARDDVQHRQRELVAQPRRPVAV
jgi:hypothetical protein